MLKYQRRCAFVLMAGMLATVAGGGAPSQAWTDASGKFDIEAEFSEFQGNFVMFQQADGAKLPVPLAEVNQADRDDVAEQTKKPKPKSDKPKPSPQRAAKAQDELKSMASDFYEDLRTDQRTTAAEMMTADAQKVASGANSPLKLLPKPDEGTGSIRTGRVKVSGESGDVTVRVRAGGNPVTTKLHFRREADQWRVFAISATFPDGERTINFEVAGAEENVDPLLAMVGKPFDLSGYTLGGRPFDLSEFEGKVILVDFWATWCAPCRAEMPNIKANWDKYHQAGFEVVAVSVDKNLNELNQYVAEQNPPWVVIADHHPKTRRTAGDQHGIRSYPSFILVGRDGKVAAVHCRGAKLGREIEKLLGKDSVSQAGAPALR